ncbi:MAG: hypothetical protein LQ343_007904 [Gyalolechia ehrenbergii]|nr:MAG: hypothetical protein LQ343_007904 [Gyalolechia ehrenbergii]
MYWSPTPGAAPAFFGIQEPAYRSTTMPFHDNFAPHHINVMTNNPSAPLPGDGEPPLAAMSDGRFACAVCGKTCARRRDLRRHELKHKPGTKVFDCPKPDCVRKGLQGFDRKDKMISHMKILDYTRDSLVIWGNFKHMEPTTTLALAKPSTDLKLAWVKSTKAPAIGARARHSHFPQTSGLCRFEYQSRSAIARAAGVRSPALGAATRTPERRQYSTQKATKLATLRIAIHTNSSTAAATDAAE